VSRVLVRNGRAYGVALENGDESTPPSSPPISIPKLTFLKLARARADLDPEFRAAIEHYRVEGTSLKMNLALEGLPDFTAYCPELAGPAARGDHAHLPLHRLRGARLGRREVRAPLAEPADRDDLPDHLRSRRSRPPANTSWASFCSTRPTRCAMPTGTTCASPMATACWM
jgi:hypothetical protein